MRIVVGVPLKSDTWNSYLGLLPFIVHDDVVEITLQEYDYVHDKPERVVTIAKEDFLALLKVVAL